MTTYKVWIQVERINVERDIFENVSEPCEAAAFAKEQDAQALASQLVTIGGVIGDNFKSVLTS